MPGRAGVRPPAHRSGGQDAGARPVRRVRTGALAPGTGATVRGGRRAKGRRPGAKGRGPGAKGGTGTAEEVGSRCDEPPGSALSREVQMLHVVDQGAPTDGCLTNQADRHQPQVASRAGPTSTNQQVASRAGPTGTNRKLPHETGPTGTNQQVASRAGPTGGRSGACHGGSPGEASGRLPTDLLPGRPTNPSHHPRPRPRPDPSATAVHVPSTPAHARSRAARAPARPRTTSPPVRPRASAAVTRGARIGR